MIHLVHDPLSLSDQVVTASNTSRYFKLDQTFTNGYKTFPTSLYRMKLIQTSSNLCKTGSRVHFSKNVIKIVQEKNCAIVNKNKITRAQGSKGFYNIYICFKHA